NIAAHRELLDRFRGDLARIDAVSLHEKAQPSRIEHEYSRVLSGAAVTVDAGSVAALRSLSYVRRVTPDSEVRASVEPGIAMIGADLVWSNFSTRGAGVTVAIIDSGIDYMHPALGGGIGPSFKVVGGWDFVNDDADPMDDAGHGTHVAGTVAANSDDLLGVAPEAKLLAYKVLNSFGSGFVSYTIAAIERCVDPNGDFDISDRVDVANASLGGPGSSDDPQSEAVDNAASVGVVFCVAAGNDGTWQAIGSPGTAAGAITVGAVDGNATVADFSSRGPVALSYTLKPDVVAPGVDVRSALLGGGTVGASGTSMATPHVAGVAALLRSIHPGWTAAQIKSAIVTTAEPVDASVMAAGAGRVDAPRAASTGTTVEPSSINFGRVEATSPIWSSRRPLLIRNASGATKSYTVTTSGERPGLALTVSDPSFSLPPGSEREIEVSARVDNSTLPFPDDGSLTHGGFVLIDDGATRARVAYAVIKGARIRVDYTGNESVFGALIAADGVATYLPSAGERKFETLVSPDTYDVVLFGMTGDERPNLVIAFEGVQVGADRGLLASYASAKHTISFEAFDESGKRFGTAPGWLAGCNQERVVLLPGHPVPSVSFLLGQSPNLRTSALSDRFAVLGNELCVDAAPTRIHSIQYEPVRGVSADLQRTAGGAHLVAQPIEVRIPAPADGAKELSFTNRLFIEGEPYSFQWLTTVELPSGTRNWSGTIFLDSPSDPTYRYFPATRAESFGPARFGSMFSRHLRLLPGGVSSFDSVTPPPTAYTAAAGKSLVFGAGSVTPKLEFIGAANIIARIELRGQLDELRVPAESRVALFASDGTLLAEGNTEVEIVDVMARPRLELEASTHEVYGHPGVTRMTGSFGAMEADPYPPTLTSMLLLDGDGSRLIDRARSGTAPRICFSANDLADEPAGVSLRYKRSDASAWTELPVQTVGRDYEGVGREPRGTIFEGDLRALAASEGVYDLRIDIVDRAGNTTSVVSAPAIAIVDGRHRPVRR
ncbi:MAG: S8 family serine peptidase, partial [Thermoanaerobaculia bacterium]